MMSTSAFRPWVGAAVAAMACLVGTGTAQADTINIVGQSFENPEYNNLPSGAYYGFLSTGWTSSNAAGGANLLGTPPTTHTPTPDGNEVGFAGDAGFTTSPFLGTSSLSQSLTASFNGPAINVVAGATYVLSLFVGTQVDAATNSHYKIQLFAGATELIVAEDTITGGSDLGGGSTFKKLTLTGIGAGSGQLRIVLSQIDNGLVSGQTLFDNVQLSVVPEPSTLAMSGTALLFGLGYARRRVRKVAMA